MGRSFLSIPLCSLPLYLSEAPGPGPGVPCARVLLDAESILIWQRQGCHNRSYHADLASMHSAFGDAEAAHGCIIMGASYVLCGGMIANMRV